MFIKARQIQTIDPLWDFVYRYLFWIFTLFFLLYFENFSPLVFINQLQTELSIYLTAVWIDLFNIPVRLQAETLSYTHGLQLEIVNDCNGLAAFLFLLAGILSFPTSSKAKMYWVVYAYL